MFFASSHWMRKPATAWRGLKNSFKKTQRCRRNKRKKPVNPLVRTLAAVTIGTQPRRANLQEVAIQNADLARRTRRFLASRGCADMRF